ncbi:MAG: hypothetical protein ACOY3P_13580 [Planctomycetota bacterium]
MSAILCAIALALPGIEVGWTPHPAGGVEYLIQLEPALLDSLAAGQEIGSAVRHDIGTVRAFRIFVGRSSLPRSTPAAAADPGYNHIGAPSEGVAAPNPLPDSQSAARPINPPGAALPAGVLGVSGEGTPSNPSPSAYRDRLALEQSGSGASPSDRGSGATSPSTSQTPPSSSAPPRPWAVLTATLLALFGSLGANAYLGWVAIDWRKRYRQLVRTVGAAQAEG